MTENVKFDLKIVKANLEGALIEEDDVKLRNYLDSYEELNKFFSLMGTVFGFVRKDLRSKMDILYNFLKDEGTAGHFESCKKMILYEKEAELLHKKGYVSGSRTLLRLHRGLEFIRAFLQRIGELKDEDNTGAACKEVYENTLAKHHTFMVRNGAKLAMYTIPNRKELLKKICAGDADIAMCMEMLPSTLGIMQNVYDRIENLYTEHDLHTLA